MEKKTFWLDSFTVKTWQEFINAGAGVSGFPEKRWKTVQQIKPGDYLLCYLIGIVRFVGILEVISQPFKDKSPIWEDNDYPCRLKVKLVVGLTPETAIPIKVFEGQLSFLEKVSGSSWALHFRGSPRKWKPEDGETIVNALFKAQKNPITREFDHKKFDRKPLILKAKKIGLVTVPDSEEQKIKDPSEPNEHTEIQYILLKLGSDMGFDIWVARNDKNRQINGIKISNLPKLKDKLPFHFDEATSRTIELIDVLWFKKNAILAAFEIESTTSIYSGLLRMADLIAMQPNLNIPLYLVSSEDRREKVIAEVNRPIFSKLSTPLSEICRFISFKTLKEKFKSVSSMIKFLKPEFLEEISESCKIEEE